MELKDVYKLREENTLGKTGQIRMEVNMVKNPVQNSLVFYPATNPTQSMPVTLARECEDTLNHLGNCYGCNRAGHLTRDCQEENSTQAQAWNSYNRGQRKEVICFTVIRRDTTPGIVDDRRKTTDVTTLRKKRE